MTQHDAEYKTLNDVESRDMERTLERGNGRSPGELPHFGRMAAEAVDRVSKIQEEFGSGPMTLNIVVHEWLEPNLTHVLANKRVGPREVTVFVGNEFFVDVELLSEKGHVLLSTGNTRKASLPQTVACMAAVFLARALREKEGLLLRDRNGLTVNMIADRVSVEGVVASCAAEISAVVDANFGVREVREDWASRVLEAESGGREPLVVVDGEGEREREEERQGDWEREGEREGKREGEGEEERKGEREGEAPLLVKQVDRLLSVVVVPELSSDRKMEFQHAMEEYRRELLNGRRPLLMDAESAGTHSAKRTLPFYDYHTLESDVLLVAVAAHPDVVSALRTRSGGLEAASSGEVCVVEGAPGPNSADALLAIVAAEAFMVPSSANNDRRGNITTTTDAVNIDCDRPVENNSGRSVDGSRSSSITITTFPDAVIIGSDRTVESTSGRSVDGSSSTSSSTTTTIDTVIIGSDRTVENDSGRSAVDGSSNDHHEEARAANDAASGVVLVGRDAVMQDLVDIAEFNGVNMRRIPDLPHERVRPPRRGRGIPRQNRRTSKKKKKNSNASAGYTRVPLGRRS